MARKILLEFQIFLVSSIQNVKYTRRIVIFLDFFEFFNFFFLKLFVQSLSFYFFLKKIKFSSTGEHSEYLNLRPHGC